ncbi:MAG TPA: sugar phosphate nucleotidyltransferase [Bryobacteraceae bacterium]|nr:sugar phosphate nucleotidyltransferase [Bryobacteraceae bacterium]
MIDRQCVILAGGLGQRMRPLTETVPKTLLTVNGRPFADYQLAWLARQGITDVVYSIAHFGSMVRDFVGDGSRWGLRVRYVDEGDTLLGTAGALRLASDRDELNEHFCVLYGDSYLRMDVREAWRAYELSGKPALMTVLRNEGQWDVSNVDFRDGEQVFYDKRPGPHRDSMRYIDYGLSIVGRTAVEEKIPSGQKADLADFFHHLSARGDLAGFEVSDRFYEIGSPQGLADLEHFLNADVSGGLDVIFDELCPRNDCHIE